ncbi:hypothetical protein G6M89_18960 [Natronolimnobius sp. AArcel1]|uniref:HalOD1 output domain-containing protein n=1 Tax=Natronolimnobius sp. AArcel1 TaxID=1679093 RepID=UPI0013EA6689|nr:HalOD1 output domain-containing protein [Natronolimnobius sp. AArcel1]NGM71058.1 hypothetical protein [Natronolimnobius sp. AArcel1]
MLLSVDGSETAESQSVSYRVITEIAAKEGIDPMDLEPPEYEALYDAINPEALDSLFAPRADGDERTTGRVEFTFCEYHVVVSSDGTVDVRNEP